MLSTALAFLALHAGQLPESAHARDLLIHANDAPFRAARAPFFGAPGALGSPRVQRVVYGYYPYWVTQWENIRWDLLTHISYFAAEMRPDGTISAHHGWPDLDFVATAHDYNVRVDLCFTLFSGSGIATLVGSATNRATAIDTIITEMEAGGADGVNIDFEGVLANSRDDFTTFITELRAALTERGHPDAGIGIAGPAVDWTSAFDLGALAPLIDVYFIMGYGYHWGGSAKAGPGGQLRVTESWRPHISISYERTLDHYTALVPAELRSKIILGVPYYGEDWPVSSSAIHAGTLGDGSSRTYAVARRTIASGPMRNYDQDAENAWYAYESGGGWRQTWYDDEESLAAKYQLALEQDIGGVGMWALGYDEAYPELWDTLDSYFTREPEAPLGTRFNPVVIAEFPYAESNDSRLAPSNYFNRYGCAPNLAEYGREWVYAIELCEPGRLDASVTDGAGVDVDLHLLSAAIEGACLARSDAAISEELPAGSYYLVADTYVADYVAQAGAFDLSVTFTPSPMSPGCEEPKTPAELEPLPDRGVEVAGTKTMVPEMPQQPMTPQVMIEPTVVAEDGCGCLSTRTGTRAGGALAWIFAIGLTIALRKKR